MWQIYTSTDKENIEFGFYNITAEWNREDLPFIISGTSYGIYLKKA